MSGFSPDLNRIVALLISVMLRSPLLDIEERINSFGMLRSEREFCLAGYRSYPPEFPPFLPGKQRLPNIQAMHETVLRLFVLNLLRMSGHL